MSKVFGRNPKGKSLERILKSPNYRKGAFRNLVPTPMIPPEVKRMEFVTDLLGNTRDRSPSKPLNSIRPDLTAGVSDAPAVTWFGHSSYQLEFAGHRVLVDPVFSGHASPFSFMLKAFDGSDRVSADDFDRVELMILTHDHYDHLDYISLKSLLPKTDRVVCSLGVAGHLEYWGYDAARITELDWWDSCTIGNMEITAVPARHFSGRTLKRGQTLWSGFAIVCEGYRIFAGGDSGYGEHFNAIGAQFGGFDLALLECGQYNHKWPLIHMMPEETVQAGIDLKARTVIPVHWGKFALAYHPWYEPADRFVQEATRNGLHHVTPRIGEKWTLGQREVTPRWWHPN